MYTVGRIVICKRGHDKGNPFVIVHVDGEYVFLADGRTRKLSKPKKKKVIHIQITDSIFSEIAQRLVEGNLRDEQIRNVLLRFRNEEV
ncbi:MAG: KOW domain-containing RNA-binding protein [Clostridiales bacterium]|jgi:ribosomal protein L14E/L6E/L27E|nr:KOW domain-containing RNA-binding protein [Clostridiales bacterium]